LTQRTQLRHAHREAERAELKTLYSDFMTEAARLFGEALTHQTEDFADLVRLTAMIGHMHLGSDRTVIDPAIRVEQAIVRTYLGPNRTLHELMDFANTGGTNILIEFSEACRRDLATRVTAVR
jgi:hypothetical protein